MLELWFNKFFESLFFSILVILIIEMVGDEN